MLMRSDKRHWVTITRLHDIGCTDYDQWEHMRYGRRVLAIGRGFWRKQEYRDTIVIFVSPFAGRQGGGCFADLSSDSKIHSLYLQSNVNQPTSSSLDSQSPISSAYAQRYIVPPLLLHLRTLHSVLSVPALWIFVQVVMSAYFVRAAMFARLVS